jgi:transposase-like protein
MAEHEVWGFKIGKSASGKNIWPNELKIEAARRIREEGQPAGEVAAELGAHECLVRKWSVADRRSRGEKIKVEGPAFAPIAVEGRTPAVEPPSPTQHATQTGFGRIRCGSVAIEFPLEISEVDLVKLVQVAGQVQ